eukprot:m.203078 g.203078  ORF g.203078 m.203078 type:complete len:1051 (+) comp17732_c0_seq2:2266-5418(+)
MATPARQSESGGKSPTSGGKSPTSSMRMSVSDAKLADSRGSANSLQLEDGDEDATMIELSDVDDDMMGSTNDCSVPVMQMARADAVEKKVVFKSQFVSVGQGWESEGGVVRPRKRRLRKIMKAVGIGLGVGAIIATNGLLLLPGILAGTAYVLVKHSRMKRLNVLRGYEVMASSPCTAIRDIAVPPNTIAPVITSACPAFIIFTADDPQHSLILIIFEGGLIGELFFKKGMLCMTIGTKRKKEKYEFDEGTHHTFWVCQFGREMMVGVGDVFGQQTAFTFDVPEGAIIKEVGFLNQGSEEHLHFRVIKSEVTREELLGNRADEVRISEGIRLVQSLMSTNSGVLNRLRGESYVLHEQYEVEMLGNFFTIVLTSDHIVVLRKHRRLVRTKLSLVGLLQLSLIANIEEFKLPSGESILNLRALDRSSLDVPLTPNEQGNNIREALHWVLNSLEESRAAVSKQIPMVWLYTTGKVVFGPPKAVPPLEMDVRPMLKVCPLFVCRLHLSCRDLRQPDARVMPAYICVVSVEDGDKFKEFDRTEVFFDSCNPTFERYVTVEIVPKYPVLKFELFCIDTTRDHMSKNRLFIGQCVIPTRELLQQERLILARPLYADNGTNGEIIVKTMPLLFTVSNDSWSVVKTTVDNLRLLEQRVPLATQEECLKVLRSVSTSDLNLTLALFRSTERLHFGHCEPAVQTQLFDMLGLQRVLELTVQSKIILMEAAMRSNDGSSIYFIFNLVMKTYGEDLYRLKDGFDLGNAGVSFSYVLFQHIENEGLRVQMLSHIQTQALALLRTESFKRPLRFLSDIDDTLVHSGYGLGGPKFPDGTILPGYVAIVKALHARVAFVTARPEFIQAHTYKTLRNHYGLKRAIVLSGQLRDSLLVPFAPDISNKMVARRKLTNINFYMQVFPECQFIWFGDSGQGDILVGQKLLQDDPERVTMKEVFIQDVVLSDGISFKTPPELREELRKDHVHVTDNYMQVAVELHRQGFLDAEGLKQVAIMSAKQIRQLLPKCRSFATARARAMELEKHLEVAHGILQKAGIALEDPKHVTDV